MEIPAHADSICDQSPVGRLVKMRHALCRMSVELSSMGKAHPAVSHLDEWLNLDQLLANAEGEMVALEQALVTEA